MTVTVTVTMAIVMAMTETVTTKMTMTWTATIIFIWSLRQRRQCTGNNEETIEDNSTILIIANLFRLFV